MTHSKLSDPFEVELRRAMLGHSHILPLTRYVQTLRRKHPDWEFPDFDPLDGGINADILFLLEKPGPMTSRSARNKGKRTGSGFISRDNNSPTSRNAHAFHMKARIDRRRTVLWNCIPGWNGEIRYGVEEKRWGAREIERLLKLLPRVKTIVLVGNVAHGLEQQLSGRYRIFKSAHPSNQVRASSFDLWRTIPSVWRAASK